MREKKIRPLRTKIALTITIIVIAALLCTGALFLINTSRILRTLTDSNTQMSQTSRSVSSESMDDLTRTRLQELADDKATLADRTFFEFRQAVSMVASAAERLYEAPETFPARDIPLPDASKDGQLSVQVLYGTGIDPDAPEIRQEAGLIGNLQEAVYSINLQSESIASVYFASAAGVMVQADYISAAKFDADGILMPLDAYTRPWYQGAASSGEPFITSVTKDAHTPRMAVMCGVPVLRDGELMGVAGAGMYLDSISSMVESVNLGNKGSLCIVNNYGRVLFSSLKEGPLSVEENDKDLRLSSDAGMRGLSIEALRGEHGIKLLDVNGVPCYVAYAPMKTVGWSVFIILSKEEVDAPTAALQEELDLILVDSQTDADLKVNRTFLMFFAVLFAALIIALIVSLLLSRRIVAPIHKLTEEVSQLKGDDLDFSWDMNTGDETQLLADSFQSLTQRMKTYVNDIQKITAEKERIGAELEVGTRIQASMLPDAASTFPDREDFSISAYMSPAKEVGGDFYDFFLIDDDHLALVIADVSGKGVPAALFMMISMIFIRSELESSLNPARVLERVNDKVCSNNREDMFVSVWLGVLDLKTGKLTAANAGHEYPLLKQPGKDFELIKDPHGFVIGGLPEEVYEKYEWKLKPGSKILVYTDGVPEAGNDRRNLFGMDRLLESARGAEDAGPKEIISAVVGAVGDFTDNAQQFDDVTMLCIEYKGTPS